MHTNSPTAIPVLAGVLGTAGLLVLAACGGGGGSSTTSTMDPTDPGTMDPGPGPVITLGELTLPSRRPGWTTLQPAFQLEDELRLGAVPPPASGTLPLAVTHGEATVSHGRLADGLGARALTDYLQHDAAAGGNAQGYVQRFASAPVVRYVEGTSDDDLDELVFAVQLINRNLPAAFQLTIDSRPVSAADDAAGVNQNILPAGQILVEFAERDQWETVVAGTPAGVAKTWYGANGEIETARVWVTPDRYHMAVTVHELLHALGRAHPDPARFPDTIMLTPPHRAEGYVLQQLDREALLAVHGTLEAGDTPADIATKLGPWENESLHVRGDLGDLSFGVARRNGLSRPWATGPRPGIDLADNPRLSGSASWAGRLLGLTPGGDSVGGAAGMSIDLERLRGELDFTEMEAWAGEPGTAGTGTMWGDGDLHYNISVIGNLFGRLRTGSDDGVITGAFFGADHEGMAGTLTRDDLSAGFAGRR